MPAGQIVYIDLQKQFGFVRPFDPGPDVWFSAKP